MKKGLVFVLILTCIFSFMGCSKNENGHIEGKALTMEKVRELAAKGEELTWSDFEDYPYEDIGSGLYIYRYEIDESYYLLIGGVPEIPPMYIKLVSAKDSGDYIDIRTESIDDFIN